MTSCGRREPGRLTALVCVVLAVCGMLVGLSMPMLPLRPGFQVSREMPKAISQQAEADLETLRAKAEAQLEGDIGKRSGVRLVFKTGQFIDGELVEETVERVTLRIAGIERQFMQSRIDRLVRLPDVNTRYRQWRADINDSDVGHIEQLIQWLVGQELYHVAHYEAARLQEERPRDPRVSALVRQMRGMAQLYEQRGKGVPRRTPAEEDPLPLLTPEQINLIRVYEIDLLDPPRVRIDPRDIQDFLLAYRDDPRVPQTPEGRQAMIAGDPLDVLRLMFQLKAREFYGTVRVLDDPEVMRRFRQDVTDWLAVGCATSRCHGGKEVGGLRLASQNPRGEAQAYTNFYILTHATLEDGTPLINLEDPDQSPLLHLGLRRTGSRFPHPVVPAERGDGDAWRAVFPRTEDRRWRETTAWIRSLYQPRPEYPIEYPPAQEDAQPQDEQAVPDEGGEPAPSPDPG